MNQYLALGSLASVSALALEYAPVQAPERSEGQVRGDDAQQERQRKARPDGEGRAQEDGNATARKQEDSVTPFQWLVPMPREAAKWVLLGIGFVLGVLAGYAAQSASAIVEKLRSRPDLLSAACTYSSVATASDPIKIAAAALPILLVVPIFWRLVRETKDKEARRGQIIAFALFASGYASFGVVLVQTGCYAR